MAAFALLLVVAAAVALGFRYAVPSMQRLIVFMLVLAGPVIIVPILLLAHGDGAKVSASRTFARALLGGSVGLLCGLIIAVFGLRVW